MAAIDVTIIVLSLCLVVMMIYIAKRHPLRHARQISGAVAVMVVLFAFEPIARSAVAPEEYVFWMALTLIALCYLTFLLVRLIFDLREPPQFEEW